MTIRNVSILSQPEGRELLIGTNGLVLPLAVSILSQPEGRELRDVPRRLLIFANRFQSSPSPKAGSYKEIEELDKEVGCFNPLPARRPGATTGLHMG